MPFHGGQVLDGGGSGTGFTEVDELPDSPDTPSFYYLTPTGDLFIWQGTLWVGLDGGTSALTAGAGVVARRAVVESAGSFVLYDEDTHPWADGVTTAVVDGMAIVRHLGFVEGFSGLSTGDWYAAGADGTLLAPPQSGLSQLVLVGKAVSDTKLYVDVQKTIGL